jgi:hypothetical protein
MAAWRNLLVDIFMLLLDVYVCIYDMSYVNSLTKKDE